MCHSNLEIELGDWVNFITGQNGSGKSAILTALCVAFGCRARGNQRASTLKDVLKTGCSYAIVQVELKNIGEEVFKDDVYGDMIIIEHRITESDTNTTLKDYHGRKVASRKEELRELVENFNTWQKALDLRCDKFNRNAVLLKQQLTWQFNGQLRNKGISGRIKISYEKRTLSIDVTLN